jgi:hypothetical protein
MKTRHGFVSNSSSSSYIVQIAISYEKFIEHLRSEYKWEWFHKSSIRGAIRKRLKKIKRMLEDDKGDLRLEPDNEFHKRSVEQLEKHVVELEGLIDQVNAIDDWKELIEFVLDYWEIKAEQMPMTHGTILRYYTSMHNDYNDGMIPIMRELVLHFMFDTHYKVTCVREKDESAS